MKYFRPFLVFIFVLLAPLWPTANCRPHVLNDRPSWNRPTTNDTLPDPGWRTAKPPTADSPPLPIWRTVVPPIVDWQTTERSTIDSQSTLNLPSADSLHTALDTFLDRQLDAQLAEFDASKKGNWLYYLPSVGISYTPIARTDTEGNLEFNSEPRPTVSFSLGQVLTARRRQRDVRAKRESLAASAVLEREKAHRDLDRLLQRHALLFLELETMRRALDIDRQLFLLIQADYDDAKISPQQFLPKQKALLEAELGVQRKEMEVVGLEAEILVFVHASR